MFVTVITLNIQDIKAVGFTDGSACWTACTVSHAVRFIRTLSTYVVRTLMNTGTASWIAALLLSKRYNYMLPRHTTFHHHSPDKSQQLYGVLYNQHSRLRISITR
jgi:hypothetical protein